MIRLRERNTSKKTRHDWQEIEERDIVTREMRRRKQEKDEHKKSRRSIAEREKKRCHLTQCVPKKITHYAATRCRPVQRKSVMVAATAITDDTVRQRWDGRFWHYWKRDLYHFIAKKYNTHSHVSSRAATRDGDCQRKRFTLYERASACRRIMVSRRRAARESDASGRRRHITDIDRKRKRGKRYIDTYARVSVTAMKEVRSCEIS